MFTNQLIDPTKHTDFMGYCDDNWISDHTYIGLHNRGAGVNGASKLGPQQSPNQQSPNQQSPDQQSPDQLSSEPEVRESGHDAVLDDSLRRLVSKGYDLLSVNDDGARFVESAFANLDVAQSLHGEPVEVTVVDAGGLPRAARGSFVRFTHLPGGWVFLPKGEGGRTAQRAELTIDNHFVVAERSSK
jgi:hypothetical protein